LRALPHICFCLALAEIAGCIPSQRLDSRAMDEHWYLHASGAKLPQPGPIRLGGKALPWRWVVRQEPSLIWSTVSMVRAVDALKAETEPEEFNVAVSPAHAAVLARILGETRRTVEDLRRIADPGAPTNLEELPPALAKALVCVERVVRRATARDSPADRQAERDPLGWSAEPVLRMATAYLNERTGGNLLAGMDEAQLGRLRQVLTQVVLRLGLAAGGKQDTPALRQAITRTMRRAERPEGLQQALTEMLRRQIEAAPPTEPGSRLRRLLRTSFSIAPRMLQVLETFVRQWDRMDSVAIEFRREAEQTVASVVVRVKPGRQLQVARLSFLQPILAFRGGTRITIHPKVAPTEETVIRFESLEGGRAELRFPGILYALVRLLALPLADAALREIRISSASDSDGRLTSVALIMEAIGGRGDPRRILVFQDSRARRIVRRAFEIREVTERSEQILNYVTPTRRYTYRISKPKPPGPD